MMTIALAALIAAFSDAAYHSNVDRTSPVSGSSRSFCAERTTSVALERYGHELRDSALVHLERARAAQSAGNLSEAHREFSTAIWLQRSAGVLTVDASYGAATVLTIQRKFREAAQVLDQLAADANLLGDAETEARVLLDAVSVKIKNHRRDAARADTHRLQQLLDDERISGETRRLIQARMG